MSAFGNRRVAGYGNLKRRFMGLSGAKALLTAYRHDGLALQNPEWRGIAQHWTTGGTAGATEKMMRIKCLKLSQKPKM